jgi:hypothetical protein
MAGKAFSDAFSANLPDYLVPHPGFSLSPPVPSCPFIHPKKQPDVINLGAAESMSHAGKENTMAVGSLGEDRAQ